MNVRAYLPRVLVLAVLGLLGASGVAQADPAPPGDRPEFSCQQGEFCLWPGEYHTGPPHRVDLRTANPEDCLVVPAGLEARSFANRMTRDVTVYQDNECSTEGDFTTYPGHGTYVPQAPFVIRAIKIWDGL